MILPRICRKRICKASAFFLSKPCPFCAPAKRAFINICALFHGIKTFLNSYFSIEFVNFAHKHTHTHAHYARNTRPSHSTPEVGCCGFIIFILTRSRIHCEKTYPRDGKIASLSFPDMMNFFGIFFFCSQKDFSIPQNLHTGVSWQQTLWWLGWDCVCVRGGVVRCDDDGWRARSDEHRRQVKGTGGVTRANAVLKYWLVLRAIYYRLAFIFCHNFCGGGNWIVFFLVRFVSYYFWKFMDWFYLSEL